MTRMISRLPGHAANKAEASAAKVATLAHQRYFRSAAIFASDGSPFNPRTAPCSGPADSSGGEGAAAAPAAAGPLRGWPPHRITVRRPSNSKTVHPTTTARAISNHHRARDVTIVRPGTRRRHP